MEIKIYNWKSSQSNCLVQGGLRYWNSPPLVRVPWFKDLLCLKTIHIEIVNRLLPLPSFFGFTHTCLSLYISECVFVFVFVCVCVCVCVYIYIYAQMYNIYIYVYICTCIGMCTCRHIYKNVYMCACIQINVYGYIFIHAVTFLVWVNILCVFVWMHI